MKEQKHYDPYYLGADVLGLILTGPLILIIGIGWYIVGKIDLEKINKWIWNLAHRKDEDN